MSSDLASLMFDVLSKRIGEEVSCAEWYFGVPLVCEGVLEDVVPFDRVIINKTVIPFVGDRQAIEQITLKNSGKTIYSNIRANGYDRKGEEVALAQEEMLGYSIMRNGSYQEQEATVLPKQH